MRSGLRLALAATASAALVLTTTLVASGPTAADPGDGDWVQPIDWSAFADVPTDPDSLRIREILRNSNRYTLTSWWELQGYHNQSGDYLDPLGPGGVTAGSYHGFSLAVSLATGAYDAGHTGVSEAEALSRTLRLARTVALRHRANTPGGWGDGWQAPSFAAYGGWAGWLLWDELNATDQRNIQQMVLYQADRLRTAEVAYYRNETGQIVRPGNTAADENAWRTLILQLATGMMPDHPSWNLWMDKNLEFMLSVNARPVDAGDGGTMVNGKLLGTWLRGSNIESNSTAINHNRLHPDYMTSFKLNFMAAAAYTLSGRPTPEAIFHNADRVYNAFVDRVFDSPPYDPPGGTIYVDGSDTIYYPEGTDWSPSRRMIFAETDVQVRAFDLDYRVGQKAAYWEDLHAGAALAQQQRHPDGKMYAPGEHTSEGLDNAVAPARAYLTKWITAQDDLVMTGQAYGQSYLIDDTDASYAGGWTSYSGPTYLDQTLASGRTGSPSVTVDFVGSRAEVVALTSRYNAYGDMYVDGAFAGTVDLYSATAQPQQMVFDTGPLSPGPHTLTMTRSSQPHPQAADDYINLDAVVVDVVPPGKYTIDTFDPRATYTGGWTGYLDPDYLHGTLRSGRTGSPSVTISFAGSRAEVVALTSRYNAYGDMYVDGAFAGTVDLYSATAQPQQVVFDTGPLPPGLHTLTMSRSSQSHPQALDDYINFDGLLVEDDAYLIGDAGSRPVWTAGWTIVSGSEHLDGTIHSGRTGPASVTVPFVGSRAEVVALRSQFNGYGDIYVDGAFAGTVDLYSATVQPQQVVFDTGPLPPGLHTLRMSRSSQSHPQALEDFINFDALVVQLGG